MAAQAARSNRLPFHAASHVREMPGDRTPGDLLMRLVEFKHLMSGQGLPVDLSQLAHDIGYADHCLKLGMGSGCDALRAFSRALLPGLAKLLAEKPKTSCARPSRAPTGSGDPFFSHTTGGRQARKIHADIRQAF